MRDRGGLTDRQLGSRDGFSYRDALKNTAQCINNRAIRVWQLIFWYRHLFSHKFLRGPIFRKQCAVVESSISIGHFFAIFKQENVKFVSSVMCFYG